MKQNRPIILASGSPRRRELLSQLGVEFSIEPAQSDEESSAEDPGQMVKELAYSKADEIFSKHPKLDLIVIGADTVVAKNGQVLGKPSDEQEAKKMLTGLSGEIHTVYTGVALLDRQNGEMHQDVFYQATQVQFYPMSELEIEEYIATGEPMDKAGAYGIQGIGARFVREIRGDYYTVVGLPIAELYHKLRKLVERSC